MKIDQVINLVAVITLIEMMVAFGLSVKVDEVLGVVKDWRLQTRAVVANYLVVPAVAVGLLLGLHASALAAAGFLTCVVCPGAPFGPQFTSLARGNVIVAVGLMAVLASSSAVLAPLILWLTLPLTSGDQKAAINFGKLIGTLLGAQLLPLGVGIAICKKWPELAANLIRPMRGLATVLVVAMFGLIFAVQYQMLLEIRLSGYAGMLVLVAASVICGWLLGTSGSGNRTAMAMTTGVRNVGVAMVIATTSFAGTPALTAATAFALFQTVLVALIALIWGRMAATTTNLPHQVVT